MAAEDVTEYEIEENTRWSTTRLYLGLLETFPKYVRDFEAKWNDWQQAISADDPSTQSSTPSFTALTALGPKVIPLVVYQLTLNPNNNAAVHLYTTLETDPSYLPTDTDPSPAAQQIIRLSFARNRAVRNALADFAERCERVGIHASSAGMFTECTEYDALLAFGQSIVPHVMLQYARDVQTQSGGVPAVVRRGVLFWYELLHELVWHRKSGAVTVWLDDAYEFWRRWFEEGVVEGAMGISGDAAAA
ncbi:hypothetical protein N658DRAFT_497019 [Parathielavia hyrcaniae]|uniref:Uncharacterized protein n=1 Tax=Parathielavia hyrcaniae TaxID=113614 RepID=A0AAN6T1U0_9PEZI|nr:hypothetical protein N658DRAFT_497019 [Parathielavia hyrcaniae]